MSISTGTAGRSTRIPTSTATTTSIRTSRDRRSGSVRQRLRHASVLDASIQEDLAFRRVAQPLVKGDDLALGIEDDARHAAGAGGGFGDAHQQRAHAPAAM